MVFVEGAMTDSYDYRLVALSVVIAVLASDAALFLAGRVTSSRGRVRTLWLGGGSIAMGLGIWSMRYVGMLAFRLPRLLLPLVDPMFGSLSRSTRLRKTDVFSVGQ